MESFPKAKHLDIPAVEEFIKTVQGKGSFVTPKNLEIIKEEKLKEIQDYIEKIYNISKIANISEDEIKELFNMIFKEEI